RTLSRTFGPLRLRGGAPQPRGGEEAGDEWHLQARVPESVGGRSRHAGRYGRARSGTVPRAREGGTRSLRLGSLRGARSRSDTDAGDRRDGATGRPDG